MKKSDWYLIFIFSQVVIFTVIMIWLYRATGGVPDTLIISVFGFLGGECGVMGWIRATKEKALQRKWDEEDRKVIENGKNFE